MSFQVYHSPTDVRLGSIEIPGVLSIVVTTRYSGPDGEARTSGVISGLGLDVAAKIAGESGVLAWTYPDGRMLLNGAEIPAFNPSMAGNTGITLAFIAPDTPQTVKD